MRIAALAFLCLMAGPSVAHEEFTNKKDPMTGQGCCGGGDCSVMIVEPGMITGDDTSDGYRLRMTPAQAQRINPSRLVGVDTVIPRERIQPSWDGQFRLCLPRFPKQYHDFYCFWEPPGT